MVQENKDTLLALLKQHRDLGISQQIDYEKFYLYSIITHSTAIEGSTVTDEEAQLLFDEGITSSKRTMVEQMMNLDLKVDCMTKLHCQHLKHDISQYKKSISKDVAVNTKYLAEKTGKNRKTIQRDLTVLTAMHLVHWIGSDKSGHWEIVI